MIGIYLGACKALHSNYNLVYQDIDGSRDIGGDMLTIDLSSYQYVICTPPCNWWSKANPYYWRSFYALTTRHLLPLMLIRLAKLGKPFLLENVKNIKRFSENHIFDICTMYGISFYFVGRHTYFSNIKNLDLNCPQIQDFKYGGIRVNNDGYNQGGTNVHNVIEKFLYFINNDYLL